MTPPANDITEGGCLCGKIRYRFTGEPLLVAACHCRHCQRQGGSAFSIVCAVPAETYEQTGQTAIFEDVGDSGLAVHRHFCGDCGSPILSIAASLPGLAIVKAGTLDAPARFVPVQEAYCDDALPWLPPMPGAARFARSNIA